MAGTPALLGWRWSGRRRCCLQFLLFGFNQGLWDTRGGRLGIQQECPGLCTKVGGRRFPQKAFQIDLGFARIDRHRRSVFDTRG